MLIPTHLVPQNTIDIEGICLSAGPRVILAHFGGGGHTNSIEINDDLDKNRLEDWLVFHSFVTHSREPIEYYSRQDHPDKLEALEWPSQSSKDYSEFLTEIYYRDTEAAMLIADRSYEHLYTQYIALAQKKKALMKNFLIDLTRTDTRLDRQVFDTSYWQIVKHYSIIDRILGQPPFCANELDCEKCGALGLKHHKIPARKWADDRLKEIMGESKWHHTYNEIIGVTREKIRHKSVHGAKLPSATHPDHSDISYIEYDLTTTLAGFETDTHASRALNGMLESVTWYLLMDYLFSHKAFGRPTGYSVHYIRVDGTQIFNKPDNPMVDNTD